MPSDTFIWTRWNNGKEYRLFFNEVDQDKDYFVAGCFGDVTNKDYVESTSFKVLKSSIVKVGSSYYRRIEKAELT